MKAQNWMIAVADEEFHRIAGILQTTLPDGRLAMFALMCYAEKIEPGGIYRAGKRGKSP